MQPHNLLCRPLTHDLKLCRVHVLLFSGEDDKQQVRELRVVDLDILFAEFLDGLGLGETDCTDLWVGEDDRWDVFVGQE